VKIDESQRFTKVSEEEEEWKENSNLRNLILFPAIFEF